MRREKRGAPVADQGSKGSDRCRYLVDQLSHADFSACTRTVPLSIAGVRVDLLTDSAPLAWRLRDYFTAYLGEGEARCRVRVKPLPGTGLWHPHQDEFEVSAGGIVHSMFTARHLDQAGGDEFRALVAPESDGGYHYLLRWLFPLLLAETDALLVRGAGVIRDGKGHVFFGPAGTGKSTAVALIAHADPEALITGDTTVIIQMGAGGPLMHSAPLGCRYSRLAPPRQSVPLAGLYALRQDSTTRLVSMSEEAGIAALLASDIGAECYPERAAARDLAARFSRSGSGIRRLHFERTPRFWSLARGNTSRRSVAPLGGNRSRPAAIQ